MEDLVRRITQLERWRDTFIQNEVGGWRDWTPTVTQGVSVTVTIDYARYIVVSRIVILNTRLTATTAGTAGSAIIIGGLPFSIADTGIEAAIGSGAVNDISTSLYGGVAIGTAAGEIRILYPVVGGNYIGVVPNLALANGDIISVVATYEKA